MTDLGIAPTPENFDRFYRDTESILRLAAPLADAFRARSDNGSGAPGVEASNDRWGLVIEQFVRRLDVATAALVSALDRTAQAAMQAMSPAGNHGVSHAVGHAVSHGVGHGVGHAVSHAVSQAASPPAAPVCATGMAAGHAAPLPATAEPTAAPMAQSVTLPGEVRSLIERMDAATSEIRDELQASRAQLGETRGELKSIREQLNDAREAVQLDPLTGVLNRRGMDIVLPRELARARRVNAPMSVGMVDLDHFKHINDTFGHQAGDRVLIHMIELMRSVLRETDLIVRYGGEEFLVILPDTDMQGARLVLDRLQDIVMKSPVIHEGRRIAVGFSAGVAQFRDEDNGATLVLRADRALQGAKRGGRSQVVLAES